MIGREGRQEVSVTVDATRVQGKVRSTPVAIELKGGQILGKAGIENVSLWIRGYVASGTIAGRDVGYELSPTNDGHLLRGSLPSHTVRVELTSKSLSWYPGCDQPLALVGPGVYEGRCSWGGKARVAIPEPLQKMAPMAKLILLGILLTERDPVLENGTPELFGIPDWPKR